MPRGFPPGAVSQAARSKGGKKAVEVGALDKGRLTIQRRADRECRDLVEAVANGPRLKQIAADLGVREPAVVSRLARARKRAGAKSVSHLVAIYLRKGWIR